MVQTAGTGRQEMSVIRETGHDGKSEEKGKVKSKNSSSSTEAAGGGENVNREQSEQANVKTAFPVSL
jgi:hypothetical protein